MSIPIGSAKAVEIRKPTVMRQMLIDASCQSCPEAASSPSRSSTFAGLGRNSGFTHACAVATHQTTKSSAKTATEMPTNCARVMLAVREKRERDFLEGIGLRVLGDVALDLEHQRCINHLPHPPPILGEGRRRKSSRSHTAALFRESPPPRLG